MTSIVIISLLQFSLASGQEISLEATRDLKRLAVKEQQDALFADTGLYLQVLRGGDFVGGLGAPSLVLAALVDSEYSIDVYEAPCGRGWVLNFYEPMNLYNATTGKSSYFEFHRSVGHGCDGLVYTHSW